ncbi:MAG: hypothetical protein HQL96_13590 [Magnetococcales bacterium]|nr:hypothetical protein [Magnetococcales bacterium]
MIEWISHLVNHAAAPWITAGLIPLWGLAAWMTLQRRHFVPLSQGIPEAVRMLGKTPGDPEGFVAHFARVDASFNESPWLAPPWREFREGLILPHAGERKLRCTSRPETIFTADRLAEHHFVASTLHTMPARLAWAGLLLTFLGLLGALYETGQGLISGDPAVVNEALRGLLALAGLKFLATISGVLAAGGFAWAVRRGQGRLDRMLAALIGMVRDRMIRVTGERLLHEQLAAMGERQMETLDALRDLAGKGADPARTDAVELAPLVTALREEGERMAMANALILEHVVAGLNGLRQEMDHLESRLANRVEQAGALLTLDAAALRPLLADMRREGEHLVRELGASIREQITLPLPGRPEQESWMRIIAQLELAAQALERQATTLAMPPPEKRKVVAAPRVTPAPPPLPPPPALAALPPQVAALREMLVELQGAFAELADLNIDPVIREAAERWGALRGGSDRSRALSAYPALMMLRQRISRLLQGQRKGEGAHEGRELPQRLAAQLMALEEALGGPVGKSAGWERLVTPALTLPPEEPTDSAAPDPQLRHLVDRFMQVRQRPAVSRT